MMTIDNIKTPEDILEYMNDDTVTWRDITDDIINEILKQYGYK